MYVSASRPNLAQGAGEQEFRANQVVLFGYNIQSGIELLPATDIDEDAVQLYSLMGVRLQEVPQKGFYILRQGGKTRKVLAK